MKKFIWVVIILVPLGYLGWKIYYKVTHPEQGFMPPRGGAAVAVEIAPVETREMRDIGLFTGSLTPDSQFNVASKISGRLKKLEVQIGDFVSNNQLVALLEDDEYAQQVEEAQATLDVAKANMEEARSVIGVAKREFERIKELRDKKAASDSDLDRVQTDYEVQEAKYKVAQAKVIQEEAALKASQIRLSYTKISASWEEKDQNKRVIGERFVDEGALIAPNTPIVSVLDIDPLKAVIHIIERDYSSIRIGQEAEITTDAFPREKFVGNVIRVAPVLKETSRQARVEIEISNSDYRLKPGMFIRARIEFSRKPDAQTVPVSALVNYHGNRGVFLVDSTEKKVKFIPLTTGIVDNEWAEILEPKLSGSVVTLGQHLLEDGASVILPEQASPGSQTPDKAPDVPPQKDSAPTGAK
jgi:RND family efflux transporter MFP subunit